MPGTLDGPWANAPMVALDLEGTGAQDRGEEAILEIAVVPIVDGHPAVNDAYSTLINPGRRIPQRRWISPGLTDAALADAPTLPEIEPELDRRLTGQIIVGHNVFSVDWRLLHERCPAIQPIGLLDTLRLARHIHPGERLGLTDCLDRYGLTAQVTALAPASQPHRALWDTVAAAYLLTTLVNELPDRRRTRNELRRIAGTILHDDDHLGEQQLLFP